MVSEFPATPVATTAKFPPTAEQQEALHLYLTGADLAIEAGAGAGKTSTLVLLAEATPKKRIQFVAFNRKIVDESAGRFPRNARCNTAHQLAYRAIVGPEFEARLRNAKRVKSTELAKILRLNPIEVTNHLGERKVLSGSFLAGIVMRSLTRFCQSADQEPAAHHVPFIPNLDPLYVEARPVSRDINKYVAKALVPAIKRAWNDVRSYDGALPFRHDHYLKMFEQSGLDLGVDVVMFDEAQDASPVLHSIVAQQTKSQLVFVGDRNQCQPPGTLVTVVDSYRFTGIMPTAFRQVPIEDVRPGDRVVTFDIAKSFLRRMGSPVARVASRDYSGDLVVVETHGHRSRYTLEHRCVVRLGAAFENKWLVYLMRRGGSYRVGIVRGVYETQGGVVGLSMRLQAEDADAAWVLSSHDSEAEARLREMRTSWTFHIPTTRFLQGMATGITQEGLDDFWRMLGDLSGCAGDCLSHFGRRIDLPLIRRGERLYRRRSQVVAACNLMEWMLVLPIEGALDASGKQVAQKHWQPISVERERYEGKVYSLEVEKHGTYVGDGLVTHNSIYGFTGAIDALQRIIDTGCEVSTLTQSFRFGPAVAEVANVVLGQLGATLRITGTGTIPSRIGDVPAPDAILTRTNAAAVREVLSALADGKRPHLVGGGREIVDFARAARDLKDGRRTDHPELACFESWGEVQWYVENDEQGGDLRLLVDLIDEFGVEEIIAALEAASDEKSADLVVSTAHKSKGLEWPSVRLGADFPPQDKTGEDELRLLYVAVTRAKLNLDVTMVPALGGIEATPAPAKRVERPLSAPKRSEHVGAVGAIIDLTLTVKSVMARPSKFGSGDYYITELVDEDGNRFKWMGSFELEEGATYEGAWQVKDHGEFRGTLETVVTRPSGLVEVEEGVPA